MLNSRKLFLATHTDISQHCRSPSLYKRVIHQVNSYVVIQFLLIHLQVTKCLMFFSSSDVLIRAKSLTICWMCLVWTLTIRFFSLLQLKPTCQWVARQMYLYSTFHTQRHRKHPNALQITQAKVQDRNKQRLSKQMHIKTSNSTEYNKNTRIHILHRLTREVWVGGVKK